MVKSFDLELPPSVGYDPELIKQHLRREFSPDPEQSFDLVISKRSIDARKKNVKFRIRGEVYINEAIPELNVRKIDYPNVSGKPVVIIVGCGPAGLFAALQLIEAGVKPIVIERGSDVRKRRRDLAAINKDHIVNPESNYCFGEGGAGTYSDGKLYTRSKKRGDIKRILEILVAHGAREEILYDAHPHIGTNRLPGIIKAIRESIQHAGGEILFDTRVDDLILSHNEAKGIKTNSGEKIMGEAVILATGHSARDIFELLQSKNIKIEAKPFALGVRIEHPQQLIDQIQYHCKTDRGAYLPAASYALVHQASEGQHQRGVFSFCMCPGGFIVPAATKHGEIVVNGMSPSRRDSKFANSGMVVSLDSADFKAYQRFGALAGMYFQKEVEEKACSIAGGDQTAPAQRLIDFIEKRKSGDLADTSYQPGIISVDFREFLPGFIVNALKQSFIAFGKKMRGYLTNEAQLIGIESRTSSPVRIPRDPQSLQHPEINGLYPCGEGAGYAGGIVSAAMDGERCARAIAEVMLKKDDLWSIKKQ